jgi:serine protease Do
MGSVTKGILSGKDRQVTVSVSSGSLLVDVIQTDAAINPGNSGGPLVNMNGEVIGITSLKLVEDEIEGMGFALPIEYALAYTDRLENGEKIVRPMLGVQLSDLSNAVVLRSYQITVSDSITSGVVLLNVEKGSSAETAGLKAGDVITKINDGVIKDTATFRYNLYKYSVGDTISITYIRDNKETTVFVKLIDKLN